MRAMQIARSVVIDCHIEDVFRYGAPRPLHRLVRVGIGRDVARQLRALKHVLERR